MRRLALMLVSACAAAGAAVSGCAGPNGQIVVDPGDLSEASGAPRVDSISELGGSDVVLTADLPAPSAGDGTATVGEALWVHGSNFGRRPTVSVGGHPSVVLARTADGGLVTRVPPGVPVGRQSLAIATEGGTGELPITLRRLVATLAPGAGTLALLDLGAGGPRAAGSVAAQGGLLQVGADGRAAYVLDAATARLTVSSCRHKPARGRRHRWTSRANPRRRRTRGRRPRWSSPRRRTRRRCWSCGTRITILDTSAALRPTRSRPRPLPAALVTAGVTGAAFAPDGRSVVVACADNRLALLDVSASGRADLRATVDVAPGARAPVIVDVAFAPDGRTVWLALGDTPRSQVAGAQPTEIVAVRIAPAGTAAPLMSVARRVTIDEAARPVRVSAGRARPLQSGASIRLPPERATVFLTAFRKTGGAAVFRLGAEDHAVLALEAPANVDLGRRRVEPGRRVAAGSDRGRRRTGGGDGGAHRRSFGGGRRGGAGARGTKGGRTVFVGRPQRRLPVLPALPSLASQP